MCVTCGSKFSTQKIQVSSQNYTVNCAPQVTPTTPHPPLHTLTVCEYTQCGNTTSCQWIRVMIPHVTIATLHSRVQPSKGEVSGYLSSQTED